MIVGGLYLAGGSWLGAVLAAFAAGCALIAFSYVRSEGPSRVKLGCALLKILAWALLLACLLEPMWSGQRPKPGANLFAVVADNSRSMLLRGAGETQARADAMHALLTGDKAEWREALAQDFEVRNWLADTRLQATQDFHELNLEGRNSALGSALRTLAERTRGQPLAGVLLLTDGVASDITPASDFSGFPPVYPVVIGSDSAAKDLAVAETSVTQTSFEDAPVTVQAGILASGFDGQNVQAQLIGIEDAEAEKVLAEQTITIPRGEGRALARFQLRPAKSGVRFYRVRVSARDGKPFDGEATSENNETVVCVDRSGGPHRILYVSGRPNWEYKYIRRAVEGDDQTQLVGLIRIAKREAKFEFRGRVGESSNPLFRGFGNQSREEIERYDQPVFVRLETEDASELANGFPKTAEELFKYRAIIIDDLEAEFFSTDMMSLVQRFVSERGGGLLMLGGAESFAEGKYARTPMADLLPVYLRGDRPVNSQWHLKLSREGMLQPWARLRTNEGQERERLDTLPQFDVLNVGVEAKPAATVIATASDGARELPALVAQRFGRGRSAALMIGDLWKSGLGDEEKEKDLGKLWRQIVRWLVADVPARVEVRAEPQPETQSVRILVRPRDAKFQPLDNASVTLRVQQIGAPQPVTLTAEASSDEPGLYVASYVPRESGGYRVDAAVTDENAAAIGSGTAGWTTDLAATEFRSLTPNRALMKELARKTGGEVVPADGLDAFVRSLPSRRAPVVETWTRPLWHTGWVLAAALACFLAEWGIRRKHGLA